MYAITGATGHVGSATLRALQRHGAPVRALTRSPERAHAWRAEGIDAVAVDLADTPGLTRALDGCSAALVMVPFDLMSADPAASHDRMIEGITAAVAAANLPHVVLLSSVGADLDSGTGPIEALARLERQLRDVTPILTAVRPSHFQEKVADVLPAVLADGILPVFASSAERTFPMVATTDVGEIVADLLTSEAATHQEIDVLGPPASEADVAAVLTDELGSPVHPVTIPQDQWNQSLIAAGFSPAAAAMIAALYAADEDGLLEPRAAQRVTGTTPLADTVTAEVRRHQVRVAP